MEQVRAGALLARILDWCRGQEATDLHSEDPLGFFDLRPYTERLAEAEMKTGLSDAMVIGQATLDGRPLRSPLPVDTTTGWTVPRGGVLDVRYQPQRTFEIALVVSFAGLILCGYLFVRRRSA